MTPENELKMLYPHFVSRRSTPPKLTPEHRAELKRRHANLDDTVSGEEMIEMVMRDLRLSSQDSQRGDQQ